MKRYILAWHRLTPRVEYWYRVDPNRGVIVSFNRINREPELWLCKFYPDGERNQKIYPSFWNHVHSRVAAKVMCNRYLTNNCWTPIAQRLANWT